MRNDDWNHPDPGKDPSPDRPDTARTRVWVASMGVMALLMAWTCWVIASWASAWLVPPYLILMACLLLPSAGRPQGVPAGTGPGLADVFEPARPVEGPADRPAPEASPAPAEAPDGAESAAAPPPSKGRRGKGRARKAKPAAEPEQASWIEVAPGKFVRVEGPRPSAETGPHDWMGIPVEVDATPRPDQADEWADGSDPAEAPGSEEAPTGAESDRPAEARSRSAGFVGEPAEDVSPAFGPSEGPGGHRIGGIVGTGRWPAFEFAERVRTSREVEEPPAADGIAPQADQPTDGPEADRPEATDEAEPTTRGSDDRATEPGSTGVELDGEPEDRATAPGSGGPGEDDRPAVRSAEEWAGTHEADDLSTSRGPGPDSRRAPVGPIAAAVEGSMATDGGDDPTETAVDETVLDDAGPPSVAPRSLDELPADDAPEPGAPRGVPAGSSWWTGRLAPRVRIRAGSDSRASSNAAPPRRPVRSRGPSRRPPDPRRLTRRGAGRPRQITRAFPPRSPPGKHVGRR